jgi:pyruvate dehydrogenase E2 component (dihydrolipoamide acetyltransferase)
MAEIIMPKMGDAMDAGVIVQWLKQVGDTVAADDALLEIETDKSNVEVPADAAGVVHEIRFAPGDSVPVGTVVAVIGQGAPPAGGGTPAAKPAAPAAPQTSEEKSVPQGEGPQAAPSAPSAPASNGQSNGVAARPTAPLAVPSGPFRPYGDSFVGALPEALGGSASVLGEPLTVGSGDEKVKASPLARAIAAANGVDLAALSISGTITRADVEAALEAPKPASATAPADEVEVQDYNAMRRTIAKRLLESKTTIPHFYVTIEIDMEALLTLREEINAGAGDKAPKISVNDCMIKAVAVALSENPNLNARFDNNKRLVSKGLHIGFGVSLPDGLIVPVIRHCETKSLRGIARETKPLIDKARAGKLAPAEYTGGTFTISNMGNMADIENFAAIINPGEGAILAVSSTRSVPAVVDGQVVPRRRMKVTLSADHRVVDGADGANFLTTLKRVIENPLQMLV